MRVPQQPMPVRFKRAELRVNITNLYRCLKGLLSPRELDVIQRVLVGRTLKSIAEELHLDITTVSTYKARIYGKLDICVHNPYEMAAYACKEGILLLEEHP